jgi:endonuclease/exonuclease/phosphatase (EEP) superfamily protein YafD
VTVRRAYAIAVAAPWVAWALARGLALDARYPVVAAMAYTPYVAVSSPAPVLLALALRRWVVAAVGAVAAAALLLAVAPRALAGPEPPAGGPRLVVMTANLYVGRGDPAAVVAAVRAQRVDVLSLQELTPDELRRLDAAGLRELLPYRVAAPDGGASGSGLFARVPLRALPEAPLPGIAHQPHAALTVADTAVRVKLAHPRPPVSRAAESRWQAAIETLPSSDSRGDVQLIAGDLNATLDHRALRALLDRGYADAADAAGAGLTWTWPARDHPHLLPITIDHILVDRRVRTLSVTAVRIPGSDHRALIAHLRLPHKAT